MDLSLEKINFYELYTNDYNVKDIYAMRQKWKKGIVFERDKPRKSNAIIFLDKCSGRYFNNENNILEAPEKSIVFLPKGSRYSVLNVDCKESVSDAFMVEFNVGSENREYTFSDFPFLINGTNVCILADLIKKIVSLYESTVKSPLEMKAKLFELLSLISREDFEFSNKKYSVISAGIKLLEQDVLSDLSFEDIAKMCNVSVGYFRKLFFDYAGKSPMQYKIDIKIDMAKNLLKGSSVTVEYISETLGFESSAYFCRLFKRKTGKTPSEFRE